MQAVSLYSSIFRGHGSVAATCRSVDASDYGINKLATLVEIVEEFAF
jgi:hypothetical protein